MSALRRIQRELRDLSTGASIDHQNVVFSVSPVENNLYVWKGYIFGPEGSPYHGGIFKIVIEFPANYPFKPPHIYFQTKIYHPNISEQGAICLDILKDKWTPALDISKVLLSISSLLTDPNPNDPLAPEVAHIYKMSKTVFEKKAKEWTMTYAQQP